MARRVAVQPARLPDRLPEARRHAAPSGCRCSRTSGRGSHPARGRHDHLAAARRPASRPRQAARALRAQRRGRGHDHLAPRRAHRGPRDRRSHRGARTQVEQACGRSSSRRRRAVEWSEIAVLCRTSRLFFLLQQTFAEREIPAEIVGLAGLFRSPRSSRSSPTRGPANDAMACVALARILIGPRYRVGFKDLALVAELGQGQELRLARRGRRRRGDAVPVRRGARAPRRGRGALRRGPHPPRGVPRRAVGVARRRPPPGAGVPGRGHPAHRHPRRARGRRRPRGRRPALAQPGGLPRSGARVRARRGRAHPARLPRLRRLGRSPREGRVGARAAQRVRLGQGHDDPPGQGARVRPRVRAGGRGRADALQAHPAEPRRARLLARLRAARRRGHPAHVRRRALPLQARPAGPGGHRRTPHDVRGPHPRAPLAARERLELVRRERARQGPERVLRRARRLGHHDRGGRRDDRGIGPALGRRRPRRAEPHARLPRVARARLARPGEARRRRRDLPLRLAAHRRRRHRGRRRADRARRCARRRGPRGLRARGRRPPPARRPPARARGRRGGPERRARPPGGRAPATSSRT